MQKKVDHGIAAFQIVLKSYKRTSWINVYLQLCWLDALAEVAPVVLQVLEVADEDFQGPVDVEST